MDTACSVQVSDTSVTSVRQSFNTGEYFSVTQEKTSSIWYFLGHQRWRGSGYLSSMSQECQGWIGPLSAWHQGPTTAVPLSPGLSGIHQGRGGRLRGEAKLSEKNWWWDTIDWLDQLLSVQIWKHQRISQVGRHFGDRFMSQRLVFKNCCNTVWLEVLAMESYRQKSSINLYRLPE